MKATGCCQYTIRQIPGAVDKSVRRKSRVEAVRHNDLDFMVGSWVEDEKFDEAIAAQDIPFSIL